MDIEEEKKTISVQERTYRKAYKELLEFLQVNERGVYNKVQRALYSLGYKDL
jgi:pilus assembly protein TadC